MVEADWSELWQRAVATLGSTSVGIQWLESIPVNPSWTIKSFSRGDTIPEPFASYIRDHHPELIPYFRLVLQPD